MYATDYADNNSYQRVSMRMSSCLFFNIRTNMTDWIGNIDEVISFYSNVIAEVLN